MSRPGTATTVLQVCGGTTHPNGKINKLELNLKVKLLTYLEIDTKIMTVGQKSTAL